jgi:hypothetical protein
MNLGNTEHTLQLTGADPEEECQFDFASEQVTVGPGQQKTVEVSVTAGRPGLVSAGKLYGFSITGRSLQSTSVFATTQGQLEVRPLLSVGSLLTIMILVASIGVWIAFRPQPPTIFVAIRMERARPNPSPIFRPRVRWTSWRGMTRRSR